MYVWSFTFRNYLPCSLISSFLLLFCLWFINCLVTHICFLRFVLFYLSIIYYYICVICLNSRIYYMYIGIPYNSLFPILYSYIFRSHQHVFYQIIYVWSSFRVWTCSVCNGTSIVILTFIHFSFRLLLKLKINDIT